MSTADLEVEQQST